MTNFYFDEGRTWLMHLCIRTDPSGSTALYFGRICPSSPFERHRRFTSPSKRAADSQKFWRLSNTDDPVYVNRWATSPALRWRSSEREKKLSNRLAASSFLQSFRCDRRRLSPIWQLICQISQLIFDWSQLNASHDVPACKVTDLRTMDRHHVRGHNGRVGGQRKWRMESKNAFRFPSLAVRGWTVNPFYSQSTLGSPCVLAIDPRQSMRTRNRPSAVHAYSQSTLGSPCVLAIDPRQSMRTRNRPSAVHAYSQSTLGSPCVAVFIY